MGFSQKEQTLVDQLTTFSDGISNDPGLYQMGQPDADAIAQAVSQFIAARTIAVNPATRNVGTIDEKDAKKASALGICRVYYRQIQNNNGVSNDDKLLIGVLPFNNSRTVRPCPDAAPALSILAATPLAFTARFEDGTDPASRALPLGATMCQLFVEVGEANAEVFDSSKARFVGNFTTNPMVVVFDADDRGKQATLFARWGGKRNEFGMWSLPVAMTIAA
jgi:hypothetical protein